MRNTTHQSVLLRERPAQIVRVRETELMRESITNIIVDHMMMLWCSLLIVLLGWDAL
jgi:hypothetical protein